MTPAIVVELPPDEAASPYARALLDSCSVGTQGRARCSFGQQATSDRSIAVAIVTWDPAGHVAARIEIGVRVEGARKWQARDLTFSAADPEVERWRATGFAIATVVGEILEQKEAGNPHPAAAPESAPTKASTAEPVSGEPRYAARPDRAVHRWWADGTFVLGIAEADGGVAPGGALRLSRQVDARQWFVAGEAHCSAQTASSVQIVRAGISAGVGLVALETQGRLRLALRIEPTVDLLDVAGTDRATGRSGNKARAVLGVRQAAEMAWMGSEQLGFVVGATVREWAGPVQILEHSAPVTLVPSADFAVEGGFRLSFE